MTKANLTIDQTNAVIWEKPRLRILIITDYLPYPLIAGDLIRTYNLLQRVAKHHQVSVAGFFVLPDEADHVLAHFRKFCYKVEAIKLPHPPKWQRLPGIIRYALTGKPYEFEFLYVRELVNKIRRLLTEDVYDVVQIEQSRMAPYVELLPEEMGPKRILIFHNVAADQYDRISVITASPITRLRVSILSRMLRNWEPQYAERFDRSVTVSEVDRQILLHANSRLHVDVVPNGVDTQIYQPLVVQPEIPGLLFIGNMAYKPCSDGAVWFCNEVLPIVRRSIKEMEIWIVGNDPPPSVKRLEGDGVYVTGRVTEVVPYYRKSNIAVVPIRAGGGTRLKILEAMALGRPVVSTSVGCEGLNVQSGRHLLVADTPHEFAVNIVRLLGDRILSKKIAEEARRLVVEQYDWDVVASQMLNVYSEVAQSSEISQN